MASENKLLVKVSHLDNDDFEQQLFTRVRDIQYNDTMPIFHVKTLIQKKKRIDLQYQKLILITQIKINNYENENNTKSRPCPFLLYQLLDEDTTDIHTPVDERLYKRALPDQLNQLIQHLRILNMKRKLNEFRMDQLQTILENVQ